MIRVLVVGNNRLFRECLAHVLNERLDIVVLGATCDPRSALAMAQDLEPHVALVNIDGPGCGTLVRTIAESGARTKVVALGQCDQAGVTVVLDGSLADIVAALHGAVHGSFAPDTSVPALPDPSASSYQLTPRETQIVELIDRGFSNKEIARELNVAVPTVKNHVHNILEKLQVRRRGEAAAKVRDPSRPAKRRRAPSHGRTHVARLD